MAHLPGTVDDRHWKNWVTAHDSTGAGADPACGLIWSYGSHGRTRGSLKCCFLPVGSLRAIVFVVRPPVFGVRLSVGSLPGARSEPSTVRLAYPIREGMQTAFGIEKPAEIPNKGRSGNNLIGWRGLALIITPAKTQYTHLFPGKKEPKNSDLRGTCRGPRVKWPGVR